MLYDLAPSHLSGQVLVDFTSDLNETFLTNFKRVQEDVSWFVDKHDYRNKEAYWNNSKDSLPRSYAIIQLPGIQSHTATP